MTKRRSSRRAALAAPLPTPTSRTQLVAIALLAAVALLPVVFMPRSFDPFVLAKQTLLVTVAATLLVTIAAHGIFLPRGRLARCLLPAWLFLVLIAFLGSGQRVTAIAGNLGYRFGAISYLALAIVFVAAASIVTSEREARALLRAGAAGFAGVFLYGLLQFAGADPFHWATGSSAVFSTLGNANDLAAYAVLSIGWLGALRWGKPRAQLASLVAGTLAIALLVVMSESRSGLAGLAVSFLALPSLAWANRWAAADRRTLVVALGGVVVAAAIVGLLSGQAATLRDRFQALDGGEAGDASSIQTRVDIWRGTLAVVGKNPVLGVGPDGLLPTFNRDRPGDLGPPFDQTSTSGYDPLVGSPHALPLEMLVTFGIPGALLWAGGVAVLAAACWQWLRRRRSDLAPFVCAGLMGYGVIAAFNPLSLAPVAVVALFLGMAARQGVVGENVPVTQRIIRRPALIAAPLLASGLALYGAIYLWADHRAFLAAEAAANRDDARAFALARDAASVAPFEVAYRRQRVQGAANLAVRNRDLALLGRALDEEEQFLADFPGLASDYLLLARLRMQLGLAGVDQALLAARAASPHGVNTAAEIERLTAIQATLAR